MIPVRWMILPWQDHRVSKLLRVLVTSESDEERTKAERAIPALCRDRMRGIRKIPRRWLQRDPMAPMSEWERERMQRELFEDHIPVELYLVTPPRWRQVQQEVARKAAGLGMTPGDFRNDRLRAALYCVAKQVLDSGSDGTIIPRLRRMLGKELVRDLRSLTPWEFEPSEPLSLSAEAESMECARGTLVVDPQGADAELTATFERDRLATGLRQGGLSPREAEVVLLHIHGQRLTVIAAQLGKAPSTVRTWWLRARRKLRHKPDEVRRLLDGGELAPAPMLADDMGVLTPREREVWSLKHDAVPPRQIATRLGVAPATVRVHLHRARLKVARKGTPHPLPRAVA